MGLPLESHVPTSPHDVGITLDTPLSRSVPEPLEETWPVCRCGTTQLVCSGDSHATPLSTMKPWQQLRRPPGRSPQPVPPHAPHVLGQHAWPLGERMPVVHIGGAGGGAGGGAAGGDGGWRRAYMVKPACASLAEDGQPMHSIASSPLL